VRRDANDTLKALEKKSEITQDDCKKAMDKVQKLTDEYVDMINSVLSAKENEILGK
jgi:ribosome recycling factor